jgi:hypothetical protein
MPNDIIVKDPLTGEAALVRSGKLKVETELSMGLVPDDYDYIALTYVAAGNGAGEIETVTYKTGGSDGTTVAVLTLGYDANDKLSTVTKTDS